MRLCDRAFEGPLDSEAPGVQGNTPTVFVIVCECNDGAKRMVDVGHSITADRDLANSENQTRWREPYQGRLRVYVWYPSKSDPPGTCQSLVEAIRERYYPICAR